VTLAERLAAGGYRTAAVVSGGFCRSDFGFGKGFQEYHNLGSRLSVTLPVIKEALARASGRPYFLYVHLLEVHDPYEPPPPFDKLWTDSGYHGPMDGGREALTRARLGAPFSAKDTAQLRALYDGSMRELDDRLGELFDVIGPEPIVVFTADHGEAFGEHGRLQARQRRLRRANPRAVDLARARPRRREGHRTHRRARRPDADPAGTRGTARRQRPGGPQLGASSRWPPLGRAPAFVEAVFNHDNDPPHPFGSLALRSRDRKFIRSLLGGVDELYDLAADPAEKRNLAAERPEEAARWRRLVDERLETSMRASRALPSVDPSSVDLDPGLVQKLKASGYVR